ncbi:SspB family protein [Ahrensia sp. 13_GOM-1096m]|uniref:SspB family protein n=1 Tax=Ahrensia sp. 13_GOM-1096m TaxID=1380380 RepID=UPI00047B857C|nr:SspB family protein [Ahrensia sp. 13_GOM-1096m]
MTEDILRYDILVQNALRGVIRKVLSEVDKTGLPGNHHFFITFLTGAQGVKVSNRIKEQYPEQMTIVVQHQYWELEVNETGFGIGLSFSDIPEKLYIPYSAVRGFYDPSVNFELEFDVEQAEDEEDGDASVTAIGTPQPVLQDAASDGEADDKETTTEDAPSSDEGGDNSADVVSLDSFRKKK